MGSRDVDPHAPADASPLEAQRSDVEVAIELVRRGAASRVRLVALTDPLGLARLVTEQARAARVEIVLDHSRAGVALEICPHRPGRP